MESEWRSTQPDGNVLKNNFIQMNRTDAEERFYGTLCERFQANKADKHGTFTT